MFAVNVARRSAGPRVLARFAAVALALFAGCAAAATPLIIPQQLTVTAVDATGGLIYNLPLSTTATSALIGGTQALNTDGKQHGSFEAAVWVPNPATGQVDLIVADTTHQQLLRYAGPRYGTSTVIFNYAGKASGPAYPTHMAVDGSGNLFVISPSSSWLATPMVWVLPFKGTTGTYGAPVLVDQSFGGARTLALADVLVASNPATAAGNATPAWHVGDLLVLVGDTFDSRVIVYSQSALRGLLATPKLPLPGPTSTVVTSRQFLGQLAAPFGFDIWPADATHGVSLLLTTIDGRIIRFDTRQNAFTGNFASGLGLGLTSLKVGSFAGTPYAFVTQLGLPNRGQILQFKAPSASGSNKPIASIKGLNNPIGIAVTSAGSTPVSSCVFPQSCSPLGPQMTTQISGPGAANIPPGATILQEACTVTDPRVTVTGSTWSCLGAGVTVCAAGQTTGCVQPTLDVANFCPGFPSTILPPTICGHAGANGASFVVVKATAALLDSNANNLFIQTGVDAVLALPGPLDLGCQAGTGQFGPLVAWAPRSDLHPIEGTIVEDGTAPYFADVTGYCDRSGANTHVESMFAYGVGLNANANGLGTGPTAGLYGFVTTKFNNLQTMIHNAAQAQITPQTVATTLENYVTQSQNYFNSDFANDVNNYSCALNSIASGDVYLRTQANGTAFSYTGPAAGTNNPNPAGEIDGRFANLYQSISGDFLYSPNPAWPTPSVPPCVTLRVLTPAGTPAPAIGGSALLTFGPAASQFPGSPLLFAASQCTLSASDGTFVTPASVSPAGGSVSTGTFTKAGTYTATLECGGPGGQGVTVVPSFTTAAAIVSAQPPPPPPLATLTVSPSNASIASGNTQQFTPSGTDANGHPVTLGQVAWSITDLSVATITTTGLTHCVGTANTIVFAISNGVQGQASLTCTPAVLKALAVAPTSASIAAGNSQTFTAAGTNTLNAPVSNPGVTWSTSNAATATITAGGVATCHQSVPAAVGITATATDGSGVTGSATLSCTAAVLRNITVTPANASVPAGLTQQFTANGFNTLGQPTAAGPVTWTAGASNATIDALSGVATCHSVGSSVITATTANGLTAHATVDCTSAVLTSVTLSPASASIATGTNQQFVASGTDSAGHTVSVSGTTWNSDNPLDPVDGTGLATCGAPGGATISATSQGITGSAQLSCSAVGSVTLTASSSKTPVGTYVQLSWSSSMLPPGESCTLTSNSPDAPLHQSEPTDGSQNVTDAVPGSVSYTLACTGPQNVSSPPVSVLYTLQTTYRYTGNQFPQGDAYGSYNTSDRVLAAITLDVPLPANLSNADITGLSGFSMTMSDGQQTLSPQNSNSFTFISTDGTGAISRWAISNQTSSTGISSVNTADNNQVDYGYLGAGPLCQSPTNCASIALDAGSWSSTTVQDIQVAVGTLAGSSPSTGQVFQVIAGGSTSNPTLSASTIVSETPEPATCYSGNTLVPSHVSAALSSLAFLYSGATGTPNTGVLAANASAGDVFLLGGPSYQPTSNVTNASPQCSGQGPTQVIVASTTASGGTMLGVGVDTPSGAKAVYFFPPNPTAAANYQFLDDLNADTHCGPATGIPCIDSLVDAVGSPTSVGNVSSGDLLMLVGDAYTSNGGNLAVVRVFPSGKIAAAAQGACSDGASSPCFGSGTTALITQSMLPLASGETPVSLDIATHLYAATSAGNIYQLTATGGTQWSVHLYAANLGTINKVRAVFDVASGSDRVFASVQGSTQGVYEFVGNTLPFGTSGTGVAFVPIAGIPAGLAVH